MESLNSAWRLIVVVLLVSFNAFFVAAEFALVRVRATQLRPLVKKGNWRARLAYWATQHLDTFVSAVQLGITFTSLGMGWIGQPLISEWVHPFLDKYTTNASQWVEYLSTGVAFGLLTSLHIVFGELIPKNLAIQQPRAITLFTTPPLMFFYFAFYPFIWVLNNFANFILRIFRVRTGMGDHGIGHEELHEVLSQSSHVHPGDALINKLMLKALKLKETTAEQIMIPRDRVNVLWSEKPLAENLKQAQIAGYSRMPLCGEDIDNILGVIHIKELLWQHAVLGEQTDLKTIIHPILTFIPQTKLPAMLEFFRQSRSHLAAVIDASGNLMGIVSFEDVLEELVGDIRDEFDIEKGPFFERTDHSVLVDAQTPLRDVAIEMNWPLPTDTTLTVESWCNGFWGYHAPRGRTSIFDSIRITAEDVTPRGLRRIRFERLPDPQP